VHFNHMRDCSIGAKLKARTQAQKPAVGVEPTAS
jgi:hypothetical protein